MSTQDLRSLAVDVRGRLDSRRPAVVVLASPSDERVAFVATVNQAGIATGRTAKGLIEVFAPVLGARGGGSADMAQGAGGDPARLPAAFDALHSSLLIRR